MATTGSASWHATSRLEPVTVRAPGCSASTPASPTASRSLRSGSTATTPSASTCAPGLRRHQDRADARRHGHQQRFVEQPRPGFWSTCPSTTRASSTQLRRQHRPTGSSSRSRPGPSSPTTCSPTTAGRHQGQQHQQRQDLEQHVRRQRPPAQHRPGHSPQHQPLRPAVDPRYRAPTPRCPGCSDRSPSRNNVIGLPTSRGQLRAVRRGLQPAEHRRADGRHPNGNVYNRAASSADLAHRVEPRHYQRQPLRVHDPAEAPFRHRSGRQEPGLRRHLVNGGGTLPRRSSPGRHRPGPAERHRHPRRPTRRHPWLRRLRRG